jgi:hypothetical protein
MPRFLALQISIVSRQLIAGWRRSAATRSSICFQPGGKVFEIAKPLGVESVILLLTQNAIDNPGVFIADGVLSGSLWLRGHRLYPAGNSHSSGIAGRSCARLF